MLLPVRFFSIYNTADLGCLLNFYGVEYKKKRLTFLSETFFLCNIINNRYTIFLNRFFIFTCSSMILCKSAIATRSCSMLSR